MQPTQTVLIVSSELDAAKTVEAVKAMHGLKTHHFIYLIEDYLGVATCEKSGLKILLCVTSPRWRILRRYCIRSISNMMSRWSYPAMSLRFTWLPLPMISGN